MSTDAAKPSKLWYVWAPDHTDAGARARRLEVRPAHIEAASKHISNGTIKSVGAVLTPDSQHDAEDKKFLASTFVFKAESAEAVKDILKSDLYWQKNVWDTEKILITPYLSPIKYD